MRPQSVLISVTHMTMIDAVPPTRAVVPEEGVALCLSGGGYRAMIFHVGVLWRLNEAGLLPRLTRISSVSGGSVTAAYLGLKWGELDFDNRGVAQAFKSAFVAGIRRMARKRVDIGAGLRGLFGRGSIADKVADAYREHLFDEATLQALPDPVGNPRFVINATNVQSGALWRFSRPYMRDWRVGEVKDPEISLAIAVAASSAFPPFLSPLKLDLDPTSFEPNSGADLQREPYTRTAYLTDGGGVRQPRPRDHPKTLCDPPRQRWRWADGIRAQAQKGLDASLGSRARGYRQPGPRAPKTRSD